MKRTFTEYDESGSAGGGGPEAKRSQPPPPVTGNSFAMKFLFTEAEMRAIGQRGAEIQADSGATLATTGEIYPATKFQELNIAGPNTEAVLSAAIYAIAHIVQVEGAVTNGEDAVPRGEGRLRTVVPTKAAAAVIGKGGASIAHIRAATRLHVHVDKCKVPPDGGPLSEQIVSLSGPLVGLQDGLAMVLEHVHATVMEPWFASWASSTNVGLEFPGIALELTGKGMRGGKGDMDAAGKGRGVANINADTSLGVSGQACQFFARSGWCRWGEACRHVHSGGPAIPINQPPPSTIAGLLSGGGVVTVDGREVCGFFAKAGWCKFGDACRYAHQNGATVAAGVAGANPTTVSALNAFGVRSSAPEAAAERPPAYGEAWPPSRGPAGAGAVEVCALFQRTGHCKFGDGCRYSHDCSAGPQIGAHGDAAEEDSFDALCSKYLE